MDAKNVIARNIALYRKKMGFKQEEISDYLRVERSLISKVENGERELSLVQLKSLVDLLGIEIEDLLEKDSTKKELSIAFAFKKEEMDEEHLINFSSFQKIVKNYLRMKEIENENA